MTNPLQFHHAPLGALRPRLRTTGLINKKAQTQQVKKVEYLQSSHSCSQTLSLAPVSVCLCIRGFAVDVHCRVNIATLT